MDTQSLLQFVSDNFAPLLAAITIISFIFNIIQYKTNRDVQFHLDSIYQSCVNTIRISSSREWTQAEYVHILYLIRIQAVSGLRSLGIKRDYGAFDQITTQGFLYRFLASSYHTLLRVKEKWPNLIRRAEGKTEQGNKEQ